MLREYHTDLTEQSIDFHQVWLTRAESSSWAVGTSTSVAVTNKVMMKHDLSDKTERFFLKNQLIDQINII